MKLESGCIFLKTLKNSPLNQDVFLRCISTGGGGGEHLREIKTDRKLRFFSNQDVFIESRKTKTLKVLFLWNQSIPRFESEMEVLVTQKKQRNNTIRAKKR